jgi:solute:Na+ symporter, SSS family
LFEGVASGAAIAGVVWGFILYGLYTFGFGPEAGDMVTMHYIDFMLVTLVTSVIVALAVNRVAFGRTARLALARA